jgi:hypothetical protein
VTYRSDDDNGGFAGAGGMRQVRQVVKGAQAQPWLQPMWEWLISAKR